jgi:hypothetical protein
VKKGNEEAGPPCHSHTRKGGRGGRGARPRKKGLFSCSRDAVRLRKKGAGRGGVNVQCSQVRVPEEVKHFTPVLWEKGGLGASAEGRGRGGLNSSNRLLREQLVELHISPSITVHAEPFHSGSATETPIASSSSSRRPASLQERRRHLPLHLSEKNPAPSLEWEEPCPFI